MSDAPVSQDAEPVVSGRGRSVAEDPWIRAAYIRQIVPLMIRQRATRTYYRTRWWR